MTPTVSISGLVKEYGQVGALQGIDLLIERGQIFGLLGPNGSGKSTLIKALVGAVRPTEGTVTVLGRSMPQEAKSVLNRLGYMPQNPALYGDISIRANVQFFARAHRLDRLSDRVEQILDFVGLSMLSHRRVDTLSGGLRQRASLACSLIHEPDLILLDEPTAGVDPILKEGFWHYFRKLRDQGKTIIITTHLMDEPLACDRLGILREGRLIIEDRPEHILSRGKTRVTLEKENHPSTIEVGQYPQDLLNILHRYGLEESISRITIRQESLEEIFLSLLKEKENHG